MKSVVIAIGLGLLLSAPLGAATLVADYQLQNVYTSSVGSIGALSVVGNAGDISFQNNVVVDGHTQTVLQTSINFGSNPQMLLDGGAGVQAQTGTAANTYVTPDNYSAVVLADFNISPTAGVVATKLLDFKNLSSDAGLYVNDLTGELYFNGATTIAPTGVTIPTLTGSYAQIVLTRDAATNLVTVYANGTEVFHFTDSTGLAVLGDKPSAPPSSDSYLTVFKDDETGILGQTDNETTVGDLARLRLYDGALTAAEVAALDTVVPEPASCAILLLSAGMLIRRARDRRSQER